MKPRNAWCYKSGKRCKDCGKAITNKATRCSSCSTKNRAKSNARFITIPCSQCGKEIRRISSRVKDEQNFCSLSCYHTFVSKNRHLKKYHPELGSGGIELTCCYCGKVFRRSKSSVIFEKVFCSQRCYGDSMKFKDGYITTWGYKRVYKDGKPIPEHRQIMEDHIGRPLKDNEVVHHINGDKADNRLENLQLATDSEHKSFHAKRKGVKEYSLSLYRDQ